jgi:hypothetical protein
MDLSFDAIFVVFGVMTLLVEQELFTLPEYLRFPPVFSWGFTYLAA